MLTTDRARHFVKTRILSFGTAVGVRAVYSTISYRVEGWEAIRARLDAGRPAIFMLWHHDVMLPLGHESRFRVHALVSTGSDGEYATRTIRRLGVRAIRGSSSRGGGRALRDMRKHARRGESFLVTPDGPKGPRHHFRAGALFLARVTGAPLVPVGGACSRAVILRSWDRLRIPKPFARIALVFGDPVSVPRDAGREAFEELRREMETRMALVGERAGRLLAAP